MKEKSGLQELVTELGRELHQAKADVGEEKKMSQDLMAQLEVRTSWGGGDDDDDTV